MDVPIAEYLRRHADGDPDLAAGVEAVVAGDVGTAAQLLRPVAEGSADAVVRVRAAAYHRLATHLRWNAFPGGSGANATEIAMRWDGAPSAVDMAEDWSAVTRRLGDARLSAEVRAVGGTLCALQSARALIDNAAARQDAAAVEAQLSDVLAVVSPLRAIDEPGYADVASADLLRRARRPDRAAAHLRDAAAAYGRAGDQIGLAACHLARGDWRCAPAGSPATRNLTVATSAAESSTLDWAVEGHEAGLDGMDLNVAVGAYADAEEAFAAAGATRGQAAVALRRSYLAGLAGDHAEAAALAASGAAAAESCGDRWHGLLARVHEALASIGADRDVPAGLVEAIGSWGTGPGSFGYALGLGVLCARSGRDWLLRRAEPARALEAHRLARKVFTALGAVTDEAQSLADCGHVLHVVGDRSGAADAYEEAFDLLAADLDTRPLAAPDNRPRAVALAHSLSLLALARRDPAGMARAADRLREQVAALGSREEEHGVAALLASSADSTLAQAAVLAPLFEGEAAAGAGDAVTADARFAAAVQAVRDGPFPDVDALEAVVLGRWGRYPQARAAFARHLDAQSGRPGPVRRVLARLGPVRSEIDRRRRHQHVQAGAVLLRLRDHAAAAAHFAALADAGGPRWWEGLTHPWEALSDYGAANEGLGDLDRACALHSEAVAQLERTGPRVPPAEDAAPTGTPRASAEDIYLAAARAFLAAGAAAAAGGDHDRARACEREAFDYGERGRARGLRDRLASGLALLAGGAGRAGDAGGAVDAWHAAFTALAVREALVAVEQASAHPDPDRLAALADQAAACLQALPDRELALSEADPAFAATVAVPTRTVGPDALRAELPTGTALLSYHLVQGELLAFSVTADGCTPHHASVDDAGLLRDLEAFGVACAGAGGGYGGAGGAYGGGGPEGSVSGACGERLADTLLEPFAAVLDAVRRVTVVPPTAARGLPWQALPWRGRPLAASHAVSYLPSLGQLPPQDPHDGPAPARVLAMGALQGAVEAAAVAAQLADAVLLTGQAATRAAVRSWVATAPVVHLASMVMVPPRAPLLSTVLLAEGQAMTVYELLESHLAAELVVLSACHPMTDAAGGDVLDLTRGLLGAGARGAVVNLWPAPARTTCVLMARFYRLLCGGAAGPEALQRAQAHVRRLGRDGEAREFAALESAVADPTSATAMLSPLPADGDDGGDVPSGDTSGWAAFVYVGW